MSLSKWQLIKSEDISPSHWFPLEKRVYQMPGGKIVDDFYVTTLADVAMIIPITIDKKVVLVEQYKPGIDEVFIQFPAGRKETSHQNMLETAKHELLEETGISVESEQLTFFGRASGFSTKASEMVFFYLALDCQFNSQQHLDPTETINILTLSAKEVEEMITNNKIFCAQTITAWTLAKSKNVQICQLLS